MWPDPLRRHRRHRHVGHRRGAAEPRLHVQGSDLKASKITERLAAGRAGLRSASAPRTSKAPRCRDLHRDQAGQPRTGRRPPPRPAGGAPGRDAGRADAAEVQRRGRRHPRQDHDHHDGGHAAGCGRARPHRDQRRHHPRLRLERADGAGRMDGGRGRRSDGTFNRLPATIAIVTNIDPEHMEHWGTISTRCARASTISSRTSRSTARGLLHRPPRGAGAGGPHHRPPRRDLRLQRAGRCARGEPALRGGVAHFDIALQARTS
jgi:hypothetical protein